MGRGKGWLAQIRWQNKDDLRPIPSKRHRRNYVHGLGGIRISCIFAKNLNQSVMTLSFSSDVYTEMVQVQQAQIQALQNKVAELQARIEVLEQQSILFI